MAYIDRDKAIAYVEEQYRLFKDDEGKQAIVEGCVEALKFTPTADVVEVRHGEWKAKEHTSISTNRHYYTFQCSECKRWNGTHRQNYCPHCGADMRGKTKGYRIAKMDGGKTE